MVVSLELLRTQGPFNKPNYELLAEIPIRTRNRGERRDWRNRATSARNCCDRIFYNPQAESAIAVSDRSGTVDHALRPPVEAADRVTLFLDLHVEDAPTAEGEGDWARGVGDVLPWHTVSQGRLCTPNPPSRLPGERDGEFASAAGAYEEAPARRYSSVREILD
jgi:hypothetical protein